MTITIQPWQQLGCIPKPFRIHLSSLLFPPNSIPHHIHDETQADHTTNQTDPLDHVIRIIIIIILLIIITILLSIQIQTPKIAK